MTFLRADKIVDIVYNPAQETALLTLAAFPDSRPDEQASFWFTGPYCELKRSSREHVIFKIKNRRVLDALRRAREVRVAEVGCDKVVWDYRISLFEKNK
jgi:hypothetical protein